MNHPAPVIVIATRLSMDTTGELVHLLHNLIDTFQHQPPDLPNDLWSVAAPHPSDSEDDSDIPF
jgi:hypothetical protein